MIGNKALARELGEKVHLYNTQMKAAQLKTDDTIYRKRSVFCVPVTMCVRMKLHVHSFNASLKLNQLERDIG